MRGEYDKRAGGLCYATSVDRHIDQFAYVWHFVVGIILRVEVRIEVELSVVEARHEVLGAKQKRASHLDIMSFRRSVVVHDERAYDAPAGLVVVPDRGGQCKDRRQDAGVDTLVGAAAVSFKVKPALERLVDGADDLVQRLEQILPGAGSSRAR